VRIPRKGRKVRELASMQIYDGEGWVRGQCRRCLPIASPGAAGAAHLDDDWAEAYGY